MNVAARLDGARHVSRRHVEPSHGYIPRDRGGCWSSYGFEEYAPTALPDESALE